MNASDLQLEQYRRELTGYCYRMLGSSFEAEDAVQETMVRAWKGLDRFEGRSALRSWMYRIATNVCTDMLRGPQRRARPMDLGPSTTVDAKIGPPLPETSWILPAPDGGILPDDPAEQAVAKESVRLAFVAALQHLPARQRAVLILREVLAWSAAEVAELLDTSVASVNSALQRARASLAAANITETDTLQPDNSDQRELLGKFVEAFQNYDMDSLTSLLHEDVVMSMPPLTLWVRGPDQVTKFMLGPGAHCADSRVIPVAANGSPAFGHYHASPDQPGVYVPWAIIVLELSGGGVAGLNFFLDTPKLFPLFGLPAQLEAS